MQNKRELDIKTSELNHVHYKYKNKEISTPTNEGYLTNFQKTKDWLEWLQKEFEISKDDFKKKKFDILFKNSTTQLEYMKLFYTNEEANKMPWVKEDNEEFKNIICFPPIYLHPLMEDWLPSRCENCGRKTKYNIRKMKEDLKGKSPEMSWCMVSCKGCGKIGKIDKNCIYRVCQDHMNENGRTFWIKAWKKIGVELKNHV